MGCCLSVGYLEYTVILLYCCRGWLVTRRLLSVGLRTVAGVIHRSSRKLWSVAQLSHLLYSFSYVYFN
jgi:hypothetical protein